MEKKKTPIPPPVVEIAILLVLVLLIWIFADASIESVIHHEAGSCVAVVFDTNS